MTDFPTGVIGFIGCFLSGATQFFENLPQWVTVICSVAIAIVTCALQIYRMIKNRDKKPVETENKKEDDNDDSLQR